MHFLFALAALITDESVRLRVLEAIFPKMHITATPTRSIDATWRPSSHPSIAFNDVFKNESVYRVTGEPRSEIDLCAAQDLATAERSQVREVRFRVYHWPGNEPRYLSILQYRFLGATPAFACQSIALVGIVANGTVQQEILLEPTHHYTVSAIQFVDLTGDNADELVVESDFGGAGSHSSVLSAFELRGGRLVPRLEAKVIALDGWNRNLFVQQLDIARTRKTGGRDYCFTKTTHEDDGVKLAKPRITYPCYKAN